MRIRNRLILSHALVVVLSTAGAAAFLYFSELSHLARQQELGRKQTLDRLAKVCEETLVRKNDLILLEYLKPLFQEPGFASAALEDTSGRILVHSDFVKGDLSLLNKPADSLPTAGLLEMRRPIILGSREVGAVRLRYDERASREAILASLRETLYRFLQVASVAVAFGIILAIGSSGALVKPIYALTQGARKLGEGDLDHRIPLTGQDELGQLAAGFNEMGVKLKQLDEAKDEFLARASHDLRNPVASIIGYSELLLEQTHDEKVTAAVTAIHQSADFLITLCTNLLDLAKLKAGRMEFQKRPFAARDACRSVVETFQGQAKSYGVALSLGACEASLRALGDRDAISRVLANLISNGLKFTPKGGQVMVTCAPKGRELEFRVWDSGVGIPAQKLGSVFAKFSQVSETRGVARKVAGTGLGLSIAKEIVEAQGGRIGVESAPGRGTVFLFTLPTG